MIRKVGYMAALCGLSLAPSLAVADAFEVAMLLPGQKDDGGFMEAGYRGLERIEAELGAEISYEDGIAPESDALEAALRRLADAGPDLVIAHGGQNSEAVMAVAGDYPEVLFSVTQGDVTGDNVSSYEVLQEESAWLAGAAAGLLTQSGVVGHISGIRVTPGLKGRGGFYHGLQHTRPDADFLTIFAGDQDDVALAHDVASAQIDAGADIIFTMLNAGRQGAIDAMQEAEGVWQFGNVREWHQDYPEVFAGSAIANVSMAGFLAAEAVKQGNWSSGEVVRIGLENPEAVRLSLAPWVEDDIVAELDRLAAEIAEGSIDVQTSYDGEEFSL